MHDKDQLDRMLELSLSSYGEPDAGLAERILARMSSEEKGDQPASMGRKRLLIWAALPVAACLLMTLSLFKSSGPAAVRPATQQPNAARVRPDRHAAGVVNVAPAQTATHAVPHVAPRAAAAGVEAAARPKLDVFPVPQPLSNEEQALIAFAAQVPEQQRQAILAAQKKDDAPIKIAALQIQPLEMPDTGKN